MTGQWNGQALVARAVAADPTLRFADRAQKVVIETLASGSLGAGGLRTGTLPVAAAPYALKGGPAGVLDNRRVRIT
ncbi:hypothetical protein, partial [Proteus terrae]|uniref:hypothetical protein n=1 Tax=Proteus terrae TaxID=1574161 RepID=UPI00301D91C7